MKFHIRTRLIESFPTIFLPWCCAEEKLHFTPFHTLRQLKRDEARFHHWRVVEFRAMYRQIPVRRFWGVGKIWRPCDLRFRSYKRLYAHTHEHTDTCTHTRRLIAGPALFRGRLRAFGKCTNGVAFSKGRPNLASVHLTL